MKINLLDNLIDEYPILNKGHLLEISQLCSTLFSSDKEALKWLSDRFNHETRHEEIFTELRAFLLKKIDNVLDLNKKTVAIYHAQNSAYRWHFHDIAERIRAAGYNVLILLAVNETMPPHGFESDPHHYYCTRSDLAFFDFIDLFLFTIHGWGLPKRSKKLLLPHGFVRDICPEHAEVWLEISRQTQYIFLSPKVLQERNKKDFSFLSNKLPIDTLNHLDDFLCLIPGGYPKLDHLIAYVKQNAVQTRTILLAPASIKHGHYKDKKIFRRYGDFMISRILERFPDYELVFRPHPYDTDDELISTIVTKYSKNPHFIFDDQPDYKPVYCRSTCLITDYSSTAYTFACATQRPVLFFDPKNGSEVKIIERKPIGLRTTHADHFISALSQLIEQSSSFVSTIDEYRQGKVCNIGTSALYLTDVIDSIMQDRRNPDWIYIEHSR